MVINFKARYINPAKVYLHTSLNYFHFYKDYSYLYSRRVIRYNDGTEIKYLQINNLDINNLNCINYLCLLSNQFINNEQLVFLAELKNNKLFYISLAKYYKSKLIIDSIYNIYNLHKLIDINFYNQFIIKKEILRQVKKQINNIINSRNILNKL